MLTEEKQSMAVDREEWAATDIHKVSSYSCGKCGERFVDPEAFYAHLDKEHRNA